MSTLWRLGVFLLSALIFVFNWYNYTQTIAPLFYWTAWIVMAITAVLAAVAAAVVVGWAMDTYTATWLLIQEDRYNKTMNGKPILSGRLGQVVAFGCLLVLLGVGATGHFLGWWVKVSEWLDPVMVWLGREKKQMRLPKQRKVQEGTAAKKQDPQTPKDKIIGQLVASPASSTGSPPFGRLTEMLRCEVPPTISQYNEEWRLPRREGGSV